VTEIVGIFESARVDQCRVIKKWNGREMETDRMLLRLER
jgi:hypothetical protein